MNKLFTVDIGNSTIAIGIFEEKKLVSSFRFATNKEYLSTEYQLMVEASIKQKEILIKDVQGAILSSTVPSLSIIFEQVIKNIFGFEPLIVGPGIKTRLNIKYENPKEIGPDRILHAVAGLNISAPPLILVDLGTGLVFDAINKEGEYLGGAIAAGVSISANALFLKGAMLNAITIEKPKSIIGQNTKAALEAGLYFGNLEMIKGIVGKMKEELGKESKVIGTGGDISLFEDDLDIFDYVEPDLNLHGLCLLYSANKKEENEK